MGEIRLVLAGLGGVGKNMVRLVQTRQQVQIVGAYSRNESLLGHDLGELIQENPIGVEASTRYQALEAQADVLVIATTSFLAVVTDDIHAGIEAGLNVICTAEEMAFPWIVDRKTAMSIHDHALREEVTVVGAGANPGYIYEVVGLALTGAAWDIESIGVQRVVDLSAFSSGVMRRLGIGYTEDTFADQVRNRAVYGHIGFGHTIHSFATRFGLEIERIEDSIEPILTEHSITSLAVEVAEGESAGLRQRTIGFVEDEPWFSAEFLGHVKLGDLGLAPRDTYEISGAPNFRGVIEPGFNPQRTVTAVLMNTLPHIVAARPGLISVTDLPIPSPWS